MLNRVFANGFFCRPPYCGVEVTSTYTYLKYDFKKAKK